MTTAESFDAFVKVIETICQPIRAASFDIGQVVRDPRGVFRGVVIGLDFNFDSTDEVRGQLSGPDWNPEEPHYNLICDFYNGVFARGYAPQSHLEPDYEAMPLRNPETWCIGRFIGGRYEVKRVFHA